MAVQLKHNIRGYHAGNISKRYLREAEAADEFELSSNEVLAYATAAGALYRLPRTSLIHRERMETFMKHLYKILKCTPCQGHSVFYFSRIWTLSFCRIPTFAQ